MSRAVRTITLLAVLLHMLLGCCLHHAHLFGGQEETPCATVEHSCGCHHHGHQPSDRPHDDCPPHEECDGTKCVFIRPELTDSSELLLGFDGLALTEVLPSAPRLSVIERVDSAALHAGPSIGLHLLNRALLL